MLTTARSSESAKALEVEISKSTPTAAAVRSSGSSIFGDGTGCRLKQADKEVTDVQTEKTSKQVP